MKARVLYITYDGLTDPLGQSQVIPYLLGLSEKGFQLDILSFEKEKAFKDKSDDIRQVLSNNNIKWLALKYNKSLPGTFYDFIRGLFITLFYLLFKRVSLVHCRGHYLTSLMAYPWLKMLPKKKYVFDMRGFWADERIEGKLWSLANPLHRSLYKFFKRIEKKCLRRADNIVTLTQRAKTYIEDNFVTSGYIEVIPCCTDLDLFNRSTGEQREEYRTKLRLTDEFVLVYLGSLGTWYMIEEMMDFYRVLKQSNQKSKFLILTKDSSDKIHQIASHMEDISEEDIIVRSASREEVPKYLSASDASIFFIRPTFSKSASSPTKHGELLGCGLPVICNSNIGDIDTIVLESGTGIVIHNFSNEQYEIGAQEILGFNESEAGRLRQTAQEYYSLSSGIEKYNEIYCNLLVQ
ncbi:MAG: glycosyltransferase family 4 protein [Bacteroidota bacterium]